MLLKLTPGPPLDGLRAAQDVKSQILKEYRSEFEFQDF
jgi:hypothetical protein